MKLFIKKIIIFIFPLLMAFFVYEAMMKSLGESYTYEKIFELQKNKNCLYMPGYSHQDFRTYKEFMINNTNYEILAVGSSRVMQFESKFFKNSFYNAGGIINNEEDFTYFLNNIKILPKLLIIGIDPWLYNTDNDDFNNISDLSKKRFTREVFPKNFFQITRDYFNKRNLNNIGAPAQIDNLGFRVDGSLNYGDSRIRLLLEQDKFIDTENPTIKNRILKGEKQFSTSKINFSKFEEHLNIIKSLSENIEIIIYLPPFTDQSIKLLKSLDNQKNFSDFMFKTMPNMLRKNNLNFIPIESPMDYNLSNKYFFDGYHPSSVFLAHQILKHGNIFDRNLNIDRIQWLIKNSFCELSFYEI